jgi:predicted Zn-dependent protease
MISAAGPFLIFRTFLGGNSTSLLGAGSELLVTQGFSQEYELEADAVGFQYLVAAHIDPRGLAEMLGKLEAEERR